MISSPTIENEIYRPSVSFGLTGAFDL